MHCPHNPGINGMDPSAQETQATVNKRLQASGAEDGKAGVQVEVQRVAAEHHQRDALHHWQQELLKTLTLDTENDNKIINYLNEGLKYHRWNKKKVAHSILLSAEEANN